MKKLCENKLYVEHSISLGEVWLRGSIDEMAHHARLSLAREIDHLQGGKVDPMCQTCVDRTIKEETHKDEFKGRIIFRITVGCRHGRWCPYIKTAKLETIRGKELTSICMDEFMNFGSAAGMRNVEGMRNVKVEEMPVKPINKDAPLSAGAGDW